jgi:RNA polymerase sigma-70 factor (ECF subfamily)
MMFTPTDDQVIAEVLKGDADAFRFIVERYEKPIFNLMYRTTGSREEAADLAQDAFLRAYINIKRYKIGKKFYSWLYTIALNIARDHMRSKTREMKFHTEQKTDSRVTADTLQSKEEADYYESQAVYQALAQLPIDYREILILKYKSGWTMRDIAEMFNISVSGAKMRVHRGLDKMRSYMEASENGN